MSETKALIRLITGKRILYIATKNRDYIRINQEIELIREHAASYKVISFQDKSYVRRFIKCVTSILKTDMKQFDCVFVGFMAQMLVPFLRWKWKHNLVITDFFISIYDTLTDDRKKVKPESLIGTFLKWIDTKTIKNSDYILADTKAHKQYFIDEFHAEDKTSLVLYLCADQSIYFPKHLEKPEHLKDKFTVLYFGSILPLQGVEHVLKSIELLKDRPDIHFIMIGPINDQYEKPETGNVTYINWLSQEELASQIDFSDLCLGGHFEKTIGKANRTIPGKVYIYEAMEKTMILGDSPANHELFVPDERHIFVPMGDARALADSIVTLCEERRL